MNATLRRPYPAEAVRTKPQSVAPARPVLGCVAPRRDVRETQVMQPAPKGEPRTSQGPPSRSGHQAVTRGSSPSAGRAPTASRSADERTCQPRSKRRDANEHAVPECAARRRRHNARMHSLLLFLRPQASKLQNSYQGSLSRNASPALRRARPRGRGPAALRAAFSDALCSSTSS